MSPEHPCLDSRLCRTPPAPPSAANLPPSAAKTVPSATNTGAAGRKPPPCLGEPSENAISHLSPVSETGRQRANAGILNPRHAFECAARGPRRSRTRHGGDSLPKIPRTVAVAPDSWHCTARLSGPSPGRGAAQERRGRAGLGEGLAPLFGTRYGSV